MDHVFCTNCGTENDASMRFCTSCGAELQRPSEGDGDGLDTEVIEEEAVFEPEVEPASPADGTTTSIPIPPTPPVAPPANQTPYAGQTPYGTPTPYTQPPVVPPVPAPTPGGGHRQGPGKMVAITLASVCGTLAVVFLVFFFVNPFGLTTGIFASSPAAQQAAAEEERDQAQDELEQKQAELDAAQAEADAARRSAADAQRDAAAAQRSAGGSRPSNYSTAYVGNEPVRISPSGYVLDNSSYSYLTSGDLAALTNAELWIARNEIYARHGSGFRTPALQEYFYNRPWYSRLYSPYDDIDLLDSLEHANVDAIQAEEAARNSPHAV